MMEINRLPAEMLLQVHQRMTPSCLKNAVLVDKRWRDVGQDPALWKWCKVAVYTKEDIRNLSIKRLKNIKELHVSHDNWDAHDWEAFLRAVEKLSSLKKIEGLDWDSDSEYSRTRNIADSGLLARSLVKLEDVSVADLDYDHVLALFMQMSSDTRIKKFCLRTEYVDLSQMGAELFASALSGVENLELSVGQVTKDQVQAFFTAVLNSRSLKSLNLPRGDFCQKMWRHLNPGFVASVLSTVEDVSLGEDYHDISSDHMKALFSELSAGAQLKRLRLDSINLSEIGAALFSDALSRLEELYLFSRNTISTGQIEALFAQLSLRTQMKKLSLTAIDLSQLDPRLLASVMARLEDLELSIYCDITTDQVQELFKKMSSNNHLKSLAISSIDLARVHAEVLSKVLSRLETVRLGRRTTMTNEQAVALFSEMSRTSVMKKFRLDLDFHPVPWDLSSVNPNVLASALVRLEEVDLRGFRITFDQATAFCREVSQNSNLQELYLHDVDFFDVDDEELAAAVTNVKEVVLDDCKIWSHQIDFIFQHVLDGENKLKNLSVSFCVQGIPQHVDQEMARKVKEKLKGRLDYPFDEESDSDEAGEGSGDDDEDEDNNDAYDLSGPGSGTVSEEEMEDLDEDAADNED